MGYYGGTPQASMSANDVGNASDINNDDFVNFVDYSKLSNEMYQPALPSAEDINRDGFVDIEDLWELCNNWLWTE